MHNKKAFLVLILIFMLLFSSLPSFASYSEQHFNQFKSNIPNVSQEMLYPQFWVKHTRQSNAIIMNDYNIQRYNQKNIETCKAMTDLQNYPETFTREELSNMIINISSPSQSERYNRDGLLATEAYYNQLKENLNLDALQDNNPIQYGITVRRTLMKTFPTHDTLFKTPGDYEFDRLMETAVYPVEPLVILGISKDQKWYFAQMYNYLAWIPAADVALTAKQTLFDYVNGSDFLIITDKKIYTNFNPLEPNISELQLDMGVRIPLASNTEITDTIDGQNPAGNFVIKLPVRDENGCLVFKLSLISRSDDVHLGYLPYTRENIIKQSFKLQGERYGWGGMFNGRDCTAFMMDIFRTFGIQLPRNSGEQGKLITGNLYEIPENMTLKERKRLFDKLKPGTALYMNGHAMLYLGKYQGIYYMIHDFAGFSQPLEDGSLKYYPSRQVAVTPVNIMRDNGTTYMENLYGAREFKFK